MARLSTIQTFPSVNAIKREYKVILPKPYDWRLMQPCYVGSIIGITESQGVAIATNGILVAIMQQKGLFIGHLQYFQADEEVREHKAVVRKAKQNENIEEFC